MQQRTRKHSHVGRTVNQFHFSREKVAHTLQLKGEQHKYALWKNGRADSGIDATVSRGYMKQGQNKERKREKERGEGGRDGRRI